MLQLQVYAPVWVAVKFSCIQLHAPNLILSCLNEILLRSQAGFYPLGVRSKDLYEHCHTLTTQATTAGLYIII